MQRAGSRAWTPVPCMCAHQTHFFFKNPAFARGFTGLLTYLYTGRFWRRDTAMCRAETKNSRAMADSAARPCRCAKRFGVRALQRRFEERWSARKVMLPAQRSKCAHCAQLNQTHRSRAKAALKRTHSKALRATIPNARSTHNVQLENQNRQAKSETVTERLARGRGFKQFQKGNPNTHNVQAKNQKFTSPS